MYTTNFIGMKKCRNKPKSRELATLLGITLLSWMALSILKWKIVL